MAITSRKVTRYRAVENCEDLSGEDEVDLKQILFIYIFRRPVPELLRRKFYLFED